MLESKQEARQTSGGSNTISEADAKRIALERAGLTAADYVKVDYDQDDNEYEVEMRSGNTEYEVKISGSTGAVLEYDSGNRRLRHDVMEKGRAMTLPFYLPQTGSTSMGRCSISWYPTIYHSGLMSSLSIVELYTPPMEMIPAKLPIRLGSRSTNSIFIPQ